MRWGCCEGVGVVDVGGVLGDVVLVVVAVLVRCRDDHLSASRVTGYITVVVAARGLTTRTYLFCPSALRPRAYIALGLLSVCYCAAFLSSFVGVPFQLL